MKQLYQIASKRHEEEMNQISSTRIRVAETTLKYFRPHKSGDRFRFRFPIHTNTLQRFDVLKYYSQTHKRKQTLF